MVDRNHEQQNLESNDVIRQLFSRNGELSDAISGRPNQDNIESEVRRTFTSRDRSTNSGGPSTSTPFTSRSSNEPTNNRYRPYSVRQNFSGQRRLRSARKEGKQKANASDNKPFMQDLVLLNGPDTQVVPRQGTRLALNERGHVISGCTFTRGQSMIEVERTIIEAFDGKIPPGVDIELLISVHSSLVVPTLAPGQHGIDGALLQRLYRNKPVYIRPNQQLFELASYEIVSQVFYINKCCREKHCDYYSITYILRKKHLLPEYCQNIAIDNLAFMQFSLENILQLFLKLSLNFAQVRY